MARDASTYRAARRMIAKANDLPWRTCPIIAVAMRRGRNRYITRDPATGRQRGIFVHMPTKDNSNGLYRDITADAPRS